MYELIYKRTIASFMSDNITSKTSFKIKNGIHIFEATGIKVVFDGWKRMYNPEDKVDIKLDLDNRVNYEKIVGKEKVVLCPKGHYTEASLIKYMDEVGVGRQYLCINGFFSYR